MDVGEVVDKNSEIDIVCPDTPKSQHIHNKERKKKKKNESNKRESTGFEIKSIDNDEMTTDIRNGDVIANGYANGHANGYANEYACVYCTRWPNT